MQAIIIDQFGAPDVFVAKELPLPKPSRKQVRVKIKAIGFNPVDAKMRTGVYGGNFPQILGMDFSGVVDAVGDSHGGFSEGDEVFGLAFGPASNGSYAEYTCVPSQFIAKKPQNLSFEQVAAVPVTYLTAFEALIGTGAFQKNRPLFIAGGSGGVGSAAISLAKIYEAKRIFTMAGSDQSAAYLMNECAIAEEQILRYKGLSIKKMAQRLLEMNGNEPFYFALDFVGGEVKQLCLEVVSIHGHIAAVLPEEENCSIPFWGRQSLIWQKSLSFHMIYLLAGIEERNWALYSSQLNHLKMLFEKENLSPPHIEKIGGFSVQTVQEAHRRLEERRGGGKLVMYLSDSKLQ